MINFIIIYNIIIFFILLLLIYFSYKFSPILAVIILIVIIYIYYRNIEHVKNRYFIDKIYNKITEIGRKKGKKPNELKILDFGSGSSCLISKKFNNLNITSIDIMPSKENNYIQYDGNVKRLPFSDKSFDIVISCFVIHHIEDQVNVIKELKRISDYVILYEDNIAEAPNNFIASNIVRSHYLFLHQEPDCIKYMHSPDKWEKLFSSKIIYKENINGVLTYGFVPHVCMIFEVE